MLFSAKSTLFVRIESVTLTIMRSRHFKSQQPTFVVDAGDKAIHDAYLQAKFRTQYLSDFG